MEVGKTVNFHYPINIAPFRCSQLAKPPGDISYRWATLLLPQIKPSEKVPNIKMSELKMLLIVFFLHCEKRFHRYQAFRARQCLFPKYKPLPHQVVNVVAGALIAWTPYRRIVTLTFTLLQDVTHFGGKVQFCIKYQHSGLIHIFSNISGLKGAICADSLPDSAMVCHYPARYTISTRHDQRLLALPNVNAASQQRPLFCLVYNIPLLLGQAPVSSDLWNVIFKLLLSRLENRCWWLLMILISVRV